MAWVGRLRKRRFMEDESETRSARRSRVDTADSGPVSSRLRSRAAPRAQPQASSSKKSRKDKKAKSREKVRRLLLAFAQRVREDKGKTVSITLQPFAFMFDKEQNYVTVLPPNYRGTAYVRDSASSLPPASC